MSSLGSVVEKHKYFNGLYFLELPSSYAISQGLQTKEAILQLEEKIRKKTVAALSDYQMIEPDDRIMVAVSGGKDSSIMLLMLREIQKRSKIPFSFEAVILDQKQPGFKVDSFRTWLDGLGFSLTVIEEDTYGIVTDKVSSGKSFCGLCSRLRRGILYNYAHDKGFNKIALGHHRDDLNETVLLNMFFNGRISTMPPKLKSDDGRNIVIRPLAYVPEQWLTDYAKYLDFPVIPCNLCGSQENLQRVKVKALLRNLEEENKDLGSSMLRSLQNIRPSQLLDRSLWDFSLQE